MNGYIMADNWYEDKRCRECGKQITVLHPSRWAYKTKEKTKGRYLYFCSWKCMRANENKKERKTMEKQEEKKKPGRTVVKKTKVEITDKVPEITLDGTRKVRTEKPEKVELVYDPSIMEEYRREHPEEYGKDKLDGIKPLEIAAVYSRVLSDGTFKRITLNDQGGMMLTGMGYQIMLTAYEWFKLTEEILVALRQLDATRPPEGLHNV